MLSYKYKLYRTKKTKYLDAMLREACFSWNHALALQKRYYSIYHKYISIRAMRKHFAKRISRNLLNSQTVQEILERLDMAYQRFFKHISKRPPKFRKVRDFRSIVFRQCGYLIEDNTLTITRIKQRYKFSLSRPCDGKIKTLTIKRTSQGEFYIIMVLDKVSAEIGKSHNGASVGIDFGLKTYLTLSDGTRYEHPEFLKEELPTLRRLSRNLSKCKKGGSNYRRKRLELDRFWERIVNQRDDYQWKLAHELCRKYDRIFIEDLNISQMHLVRNASRKLRDLAHAEFVTKLLHIASKYGVVVHKINRFYPSSKTCICGYINRDLKLSDRQWICPICGEVHDRDLLAANNILRRGIYELDNARKSILTRKSNAEKPIQESDSKSRSMSII